MGTTAQALGYAPDSIHAELSDEERAISERLEDDHNHRRVEQRYIFTAEDVLEAAKLWNELNKAAEALGFIRAGGGLGEMRPNDVIPDSPLAKRLEAAK